MIFSICYMPLFLFFFLKLHFNFFRLVPKFLPLAIQELDELHVGSISFRSRDKIMKVLIAFFANALSSHKIKVPLWIWVIFLWQRMLPSKVFTWCKYFEQYLTKIIIIKFFCHYHKEYMIKNLIFCGQK